MARGKASLRVRVLGSGSKGNALVVQGESGAILVDCGFARKRIEERMEQAGICRSDIQAILVTHEHGDHALGADRAARGWNVPLYATHGTIRNAKWGAVDALHTIGTGSTFAVAGMEIHAFAVPHDAAEPVQFVISDGETRLGMLSDAGHVTPHMREVLSGCHALLLEANHCPDMLANGPYPPALRERVGGPWGHLSNAQSADLLTSLGLANTGHIVLTHLSEQNNSPERALDVIRPALNGWQGSLSIAAQDAPMDLIEI